MRVEAPWRCMFNLTASCDGTHGKSDLPGVASRTFRLVGLCKGLCCHEVTATLLGPAVVLLLTTFCDHHHTISAALPLIITSSAVEHRSDRYSELGCSRGKRTSFDRGRALQGLWLLRGILSHACAGAVIRIQFQGLPSAACCPPGKVQRMRSVWHVLPRFRHLREESAGRETSGRGEG